MMMQILEFAFRDWLHYIGVIVLLVVILPWWHWPCAGGGERAPEKNEEANDDVQRE